MASIQFTVFFEDPFWVGLIEESSNGELRIGRVVFGAERSTWIRGSRTCCGSGS
jgi:Protein of unknown function (DUF2992)